MAHFHDSPGFFAFRANTPTFNVKDSCIFWLKYTFNGPTAQGYEKPNLFR